MKPNRFPPGWDEERVRRVLAHYEEQTEAEQLRQVLTELGLRPDPDRLLGRCLRCNVPLTPLEAETARARVPPWVARTQETFRACPECGRVYWRGTHVQRMLSRLREMGV